VSRLQDDYQRLLYDHNNGYSSQSTSGNQEAQLASKNAELKDTTEALKYKIDTLRSNMAYQVAQLDIASEGWRLFNCAHENFRDIPDGANSTREVSNTKQICQELLEDWVSDEKFIKKYNNERRTILQHHRAHERVNQGRGVASFRIKSEFVKLDEKRGIPIKY
jgi:hypothetical protein